MPNVLKNKRAFTLFELLVVIILIGIIYAVFIDRVTSRPATQDDEELSLQTLKAYLMRYEVDEYRELVCDAPCKECRVYLDGELQESVTLELFEEAPYVYTRDRYGQYRPKRFLARYDEKKGLKNVCFRFKVYENGSSSSYVVQTDETEYYLFRPWLAPVSRYKTLTEAAEANDVEKNLPTERRHYNF